MFYLGIHLDSLGATALIVGLVFTIRNILQIFIRVPIAEMSQIIGRKPLIISGNAFFVLALVLMYLANHWFIVFCATILVAIGMSCYFPPLFAYIGDISNDNFGKINGIIFMGGDIGVILGSFAVTRLLDDYHVSLKGIFGISAVVGFYGVILSIAFLPEVLEANHRKIVPSLPNALKTSFTQSFTSLKKITRQSPLYLVYSLQFVLSFAEFFFGSFFPLLLVIAMGHEKSEVTKIAFISTVAVLLIKPYLGSISDRFGFRYPVLIALLTNSILFFFLTITTDLVVITIIFTMSLAITIMGYLAVNGATSNSAHPKQRGIALGALGFYVSFGRTVSSIFLAPIWELFEIITNDRGESLILVFRVASITLFSATIVLIKFIRTYSFDQHLSDP
jgi:MFS family permease